MDTKTEYTEYRFYVTMAGELPPDHVSEARRENHRARVEDPDSPLVGPEEYEPSPASDHVLIGEKPEVDGWVTFYNPTKLEAGEPFKYGDFPFRSESKDGLWFARPDADKWNRHPVWKWKNPDADPHEELTLNPSIGRRNNDGDIIFHCWIESGTIRWV